MSRQRVQSGTRTVFESCTDLALPDYRRDGRSPLDHRAITTKRFTRECCRGVAPKEVEDSITGIGSDLDEPPNQLKWLGPLLFITIGRGDLLYVKTGTLLAVCKPRAVGSDGTRRCLLIATPLVTATRRGRCSVKPPTCTERSVCRSIWR